MVYVNGSRILLSQLLTKMTVNSCCVILGNEGIGNLPRVIIHSIPSQQTICLYAIYLTTYVPSSSRMLTVPCTYTE